MKRALLFLILASVSILAAWGADATPLQSPVIVKRLYLAGQTTTLGSLANPVPLFTPTHDGLYRASIFIQATGNPAQACDDFLGCMQANLVYAPGANTLGSVFRDNLVTPFIGVAGRPVGFYTAPVGTTPFETYDLAIVIEEL